MKYTISQPQSFFERGQRDNQEDAMFPSLGAATIDSRTFVVCDGMGGHEKGEVASNVVCDTFAKHANKLLDFTPEKLSQALSDAYDALDAADTSKKAKKMGTTLTFLQLHSQGATIAHIGDSRVYYVSPSKNDFFVTTDHSLVQSFYDAGLITKEEMKHHPQRNIISRVMMPHQPNRAEATINHISDIRPGDYFLLCSDGVVESMDDNRIKALLCDQELSDAEKCEKLKKLTEWNSDNHTAYIIHIEDVQEDSDFNAIDWESCSVPLLEINDTQSKPSISETNLQNKPLKPQTAKNSKLKFIIAIISFLIAVILGVMFF